MVPQSKGGDNSYKNIVAASFDANSMKSDKPVKDFLLQLYRDELISLDELNKLKVKVEDLESGKLKPDLEAVNDALRS